MPFAEPEPAAPPAPSAAPAPVPWSPALLGWMALVLTFLPAGVLWALNFGRIGRPEVVRVRMAWVVVLYLVWLVVALAHPSAASANAALGLYFWQTQRAPVRQLGVRPGVRTPLIVAVGWICFLISMLFALALLQQLHAMRTLR